eukprot:Awhi_evm1s2576
MFKRVNNMGDFVAAHSSAEESDGSDYDVHVSKSKKSSKGKDDFYDLSDESD